MGSSSRKPTDSHEDIPPGGPAGEGFGSSANRLPRGRGFISRRRWAVRARLGFGTVNRPRTERRFGAKSRRLAKAHAATVRARGGRDNHVRGRARIVGDAKTSAHVVSASSRMPKRASSSIGTSSRMPNRAASSSLGSSGMLKRSRPSIRPSPASCNRRGGPWADPRGWRYCRARRNEMSRAAAPARGPAPLPPSGRRTDHARRVHALGSGSRSFA